MIKTCLHCGKEFEPHNTRGPAPIYCSNKCRHAHGGRKTGICPLCGGPCQKQSKHCRECQVKRGATRELPDRPCVVCGEMFRPQGRTIKCCSLACSHKAGAKTLQAIKITKNCQRCGREFVTDELHSYAKYCAKCRGYGDIEKNRRRRAIKRKAQADKINDLEIYERDGWICQICGKRVNKDVKWPHPKSPSIDHIIPLSQGGEHIKTNVQLAHLDCNNLKRAKGGGQLRLF